MTRDMENGIYDDYDSQRGNMGRKADTTNV